MYQEEGEPQITFLTCYRKVFQLCFQDKALEHAYVIDYVLVFITLVALFA